MAFGIGTLGKFVKEVDLSMHGLSSNKAINKITSNKAVQGVVKGMDFVAGAGDASKVTQRLAAGQYGTRDYVRMGLGTYAAANIATRAVSGGGVYRDSQGNFDVAGVPIL